MSYIQHAAEIEKFSKFIFIAHLIHRGKVIETKQHKSFKMLN